MRMGGFSLLNRQRLPPVTHTDALFANQSQSILDDLVALLGQSSAWNCSDPERRDLRYEGAYQIVKRAPGNVRYLREFGKNILTASFTARERQRRGKSRLAFGHRYRAPTVNRLESRIKPQRGQP